MQCSADMVVWCIWVAPLPLYIGQCLIVSMIFLFVTRSASFAAVKHGCTASLQVGVCEQWFGQRPTYVAEGLLLSLMLLADVNNGCACVNGESRAFEASKSI